VSLREFVVLSPLALLSIVLGVFPSVLVLSWVEPSIAGMIEQLDSLVK
jgi:NADH-quinone oxidoreductase subunit M